MARQEITKEWIDRLSEYRKEKRIHPEGSVLMLPKGVDVSDEMRVYALERNIEIRIGRREPRLFNMEAVYTSHNSSTTPASKQASAD